MPADPPFVAPSRLEEALSELLTEGSLPLAGGTSLVPLLKSRLVEPTKLVSLARLAELRGVRAEGSTLAIGSCTTLRELVSEGALSGELEALQVAASVVGNPRVRSQATLGGALAHGDPRQDVPPVLLALGASVVCSGAGGDRSEPLEGFLSGFMETSLRQGELLTEVLVPRVPSRRSSYLRFVPASGSDYPVVGAAASVVSSSDGSVTYARVALCGVGETAFLVPGVGQVLDGGSPGGTELAALADAVREAVRASDDRRGSGEYKREMAAVLARRALMRCLSDGDDREGAGHGA